MIYVLVFYHFSKLSQIWQFRIILIYYLTVLYSDVQTGMTGFSALGLTRPKSRGWLAGLLWGCSRKMTCFIWGQNPFLGAVGLKLLLPCWLLADSYSEFLEASSSLGTCSPTSQMQKQQVESSSCLESISFIGLISGSLSLSCLPFAF